MTPPQGYPIVNLVAELKRDFRDHAKKDEHEIAALREDVGQVKVECAVQTSALMRIEAALAEQRVMDGRIVTKRATTAIAESSALRRGILLGLLGLMFGVAGAAMHHWFS